MRVLIIDDDSYTSRKARQKLVPHFVVDSTSQAQALAKACALNYRAIIVSLSKDILSGTNLIKQLRSQQVNSPLLVVSRTCSNQEKTQILDSGSDDVLVKPFHWGELIARLNALIRRDAPYLFQPIRAGHLSLELPSHQLFFHSKPLILARKQRLILECLIIHHCRTVSRDTLINHAWEDEWTQRNNLDSQICYLRRNLRLQIGYDPICTEHCLGYRLKDN